MANDSPTLRGYTFSIPPSKNEITYDKIFQKHKLANGAIRTYFKGYRAKCTFEWQDSWLDEDDFSNLCVIYNDTSATLAVTPRPDTYPSTTFNMQIVNNFEFVPHGGLMSSTKQKYEGAIMLEAVTITATCVNWS